MFQEIHLTRPPTEPLAGADRTLRLHEIPVENYWHTLSPDINCTVQCACHELGAGVWQTETRKTKTRQWTKIQRRYARQKGELRDYRQMQTLHRQNKSRLSNFRHWNTRNQWNSFPLTMLVSWNSPPSPNRKINGANNLWERPTQPSIPPGSVNK